MEHLQGRPDKVVPIEGSSFDPSSRATCTVVHMVSMNDLLNEDRLEYPNIEFIFINLQSSLSLSLSFVCNLGLKSHFFERRNHNFCRASFPFRGLLAWFWKRGLLQWVFCELRIYPLVAAWNVALSSSYRFRSTVFGMENMDYNNNYFVD